MFWNELAFASPYLISLGLAVSLLLYGIQRPHVPVAGPLAIYAFLQVIWIVGFLEEAFSTSLEAKILWDDIQFVPFLFLPQVMLLTSRAFVGRRVIPLGWLHSFYLAGAVLLLVLVVFDPQLHWIRPDPRLIESFPRGELTYTFTPVMYGMVVVTYLVSIVVLVRIWRHAKRGRGKHQKQGFLIFVGLVVPVSGGLLTIAGLSLGPHRDMAPLTFGLGDLIIVAGILRYRILDLVPIAFEAAFHAMGDPIVVLDDEGTILAHNRAFVDWKSTPGTTMVGQPLPAVIENPTGSDPNYDLVRIPMTVEGTREQGVIWHFRDVRLLREAQAQQLERERLGALGRMANNLAHELNTPLASLLSASRFLQEKTPEMVSRWADDPLSALLVSQLTVPDGRSAKQRSQDRRIWLEILEAEGIDPPLPWADKLNEAGIRPQGAALDPGWGRDPGWSDALSKACDVAAFMVSLWVIQESAERGGQIISAIQGLEHPLDQGLDEPVALESVLSGALTALGSAGAGVAPAVDLSHVGMIPGNLARLTQLCFQLLKNARQAAGPSGMVRVRSRSSEGLIIVEVEDDGPGIPENQKKWIFSSYFTTRKAGEGSGLGLEIVKLVAKEHGAELSFESQPGCTVFRVAFPTV